MSAVDLIHLAPAVQIAIELERARDQLEYFADRFLTRPEPDSFFLAPLRALMAQFEQAQETANALAFQGGDIEDDEYYAAFPRGLIEVGGGNYAQTR